MFDVVSPALAGRYSVVDLQVPRFKVLLKSGAIAFLFAIEPSPVVRAVIGWESTQIRAPGNVSSVCTPVEQPRLIPHPPFHEFRSLRADVDTYPLAIQLLSSDAGRGTPAVGIENHSAIVGPRSDDSVKEG